MNLLTRKRYSLSKEVFDKQVKSYDTIPPLHTYRGAAVVVFIMSSAIGALLLFVQDGFNLAELAYLSFGVLIFLPALYFTYKGTRWGILLFMSQLILIQIFVMLMGSMPTGVVVTLGLLALLFQALKVENARKRPTKLSI